MKKALKNEINILDLINTIQSRLIALDKKVDTLISQSILSAKASPASPVYQAPKERVMYLAICADCNKECKIPFKPSPERPVYCQDCFSRRKVISLSGMTVTSPQAKENKKTVNSKIPMAKKKPTPKKK